MSEWTPFPFVRYTLALIAGILLYDHFPGFWTEHAWLVSLPFLLVVSGQILSRKFGFYRLGLFNGIVILTALSMIGGIVMHYADDRLNTSHYTHQDVRADRFIAKVISDHTERSKYQRYEVEVQWAISDTLRGMISGKIYLYVKKENEEEPLLYGDVLLVNGHYFTVPPPKNPDEFNYKLFLERQNIYAHCFVGPEDLRVLGNEPENWIRSRAFRVRNEARKMISDFIPAEREQAVMIALLLGIKDYLDADLKAAYSAAGATHVLAVSGLHVGMVYLILVVVLGRIRETRWGRIVFATTSILVIWSYALITGFSPSVMRAATMFSIVVLGESLKRRSNIYNSLGTAAFLLLLYDPNFIFSVGFQLSFAAVLGIVFLQPRLYRLWEPQSRVIDYLWSITSVSIAAQIATFPLTVHYFHQFPSYFLVSNLVVIPVVLGVLVGGLVMLILGSLVAAAGQALGFILSMVLGWMNDLIAVFDRLPGAIIDWLYLDAPETWLVYLFFILMASGLTAVRFDRVVVSILCLITFSGWHEWQNYHHSSQQRIVFYEMKDQVAIDLIDGTRATLLVDQIPDQELLEYQVNPHRLASGLPPIDGSIYLLDRCPFAVSVGPFRLIEWKGKRILIVNDEEGYELKDRISADVVLINGGTTQIVEHLIAEMFIVSPEVDIYKAKSFNSLLEQKNILVHHLKKDGFWQMDIHTRGTQPPMRTNDHMVSGTQ